MRVCRTIFIFTIVTLLLLIEASPFVGQERYSVVTGRVLGIRARLWLDVQSEKDKAILNFRIGHKTAYTPQRYPCVGEKVKVEYLTHRGVPVAYTVTALKGSK
jgi:hypothetical protein